MTATALTKQNEFITSCPDGLLSQLQQGLQQLAQRQGVKQHLLERYSNSIEQFLVTACGETGTADTNTRSHQPWGWSPMLESPDLNVGALTVFMDSDIPLHDHPGSSGLLIVLRGRVRVQSYQVASAGDLRQVQPLELEQTGNVELDEGQYISFGPSENNIHSLHAIDDDCVLFDVLFSPYQPAQRSYFMPVTPQSPTGSLYVSRLHKPVSIAMN
jgi:hypothetical protein